MEKFAFIQEFEKTQVCVMKLYNTDKEEHELELTFVAEDAAVNVKSTFGNQADDFFKVFQEDPEAIKRLIDTSFSKDGLGEIFLGKHLRLLN